MSNIYRPQNVYAPNNNVSDDDKNAILRFSYCHNKFPLEKLGKKELKNFIDFAKKIEKLSWKEIKIDDGLRYEVLKSYSLPDNVPRDSMATSMRVGKKFRLIGWRQKEYFYIVWFDNNHKSC